MPFLRTVLPPEVGESARAMAASTARQKRSYLHHQGVFQHQNCTVRTVHDSDHKGVVRIFVGHSYHSNELFILYYAAQFFLYQECNMEQDLCRGVVYFTVLCDHPYLVSLLFAVLVSLHPVTFSNVFYYLYIYVLRSCT